MQNLRPIYIFNVEKEMCLGVIIISAYAIKFNPLIFILICYNTNANDEKDIIFIIHFVMIYQYFYTKAPVAQSVKLWTGNWKLQV